MLGERNECERNITTNASSILVYQEYEREERRKRNIEQRTLRKRKSKREEKKRADKIETKTNTSRE